MLHVSNPNRDFRQAQLYPCKSSGDDLDIGVVAGPCMHAEQHHISFLCEDLVDGLPNGTGVDSKEGIIIRKQKGALA